MKWVIGGDYHFLTAGDRPDFGCVAPVKQDVMETFFVNAMWKDHHVNQTAHESDYIIDENLKFKICDAETSGKMKMNPNTIYARYHTEVGKGNQIPLWLFGFLY